MNKYKCSEKTKQSYFANLRTVIQKREIVVSPSVLSGVVIKEELSEPAKIHKRSDNGD